MPPPFDWLRRPAPETRPDDAPETSKLETGVPETSAPEAAVPETSAPEAAVPEAREPDADRPATQAIEPRTADPDPVAPAIAEGDLNVGLARTRGGFMSRLRGLFTVEDGGPAWDDIEETLIAGDVGAPLAAQVVERARQRRDPAGAEGAVRAELAALLAVRDPAWRLGAFAGDGPGVVLVVGVNGTGKTTTIGKLAARSVADGRTVLLAAADTFRAAAIDQLRIWADRSGVAMVAHAPGADPGAVVFDALDAAVARRIELVIADTAGRLHTKSNLMDELTKIRRVVDKRIPGAVPDVLFVLDATTGQNGLAQARAFHEAVGLTGIVLTKLDGTARGGIVFAIEGSIGVPVRFVGVGEQIGDLLPFEPQTFVEALFA